MNKFQWPTYARMAVRVTSIIKRVTFSNMPTRVDEYLGDARAVTCDGYHLSALGWVDSVIGETAAIRVPQQTRKSLLPQRHICNRFVRRIRPNL